MESKAWSKRAREPLPYVISLISASNGHHEMQSACAFAMFSILKLSGSCYTMHLEST